MLWRSKLFSKNGAKIANSGESSIVAFAHKKTTSNLLVETKYCATTSVKNPSKASILFTSPPLPRGCVGKTKFFCLHSLGCAAH